MEYIVASWEDIAREKQQEWYEVFGDRDWDMYNLNKPKEKNCFMKNVGYAIYGPPDEEPSEKNCEIGYSEDKTKHIQQICDTIKNQHKNTSDVGDENVLIGIIYVYMYIDMKDEDSSHIPTVVFRVMKYNEENEKKAKKEGKEDEDCNNTFIDIDCRVYASWKDFLKNNKLPKCTYCYPRNGIYSGNVGDQVVVDFDVTPAGRLTTKVLNGIDIAGTIVAVGSTVVTGAALIVPVAAPLLLATAVTGAVVGGYGVGRSVENIVDRKTHGQSISLKDSAARNIWLSLGANVAGMAAAGATKLTSVVARSGNVLGTTSQVVVNATQISSITLNGVNIVNTVFVLHEKHKTKSVTALDMFQLSASILFFSNSLINFKLAQTIIQETQQSVIKNFESSLRSNRHMKAFARLARNTRQGLDPMHGDAKVIKSINQITNPDEFFAGVVRVQKQFGQNRATVSFTDSGYIAINKDLILDPAKFADVTKPQRQIILKASQQYTEGTISRSQYEDIIRPVLNEHGLLTFNAKSSSRICSTFGVNALAEVKVCDRSILANLTPSNGELVLRILGRLISPHIVPTAIKVAEYLKLDQVVDFFKFLEFFDDRIRELLREMEYAYWDIVNVARQWPNFNQAQFDRDNGIEEDRQNQFLGTILRLFSIGKKIVELGQEYERYKSNGYSYDT